MVLSVANKADMAKMGFAPMLSVAVLLGTLAAFPAGNATN
jgi:hypothetical protein